MMVMCRMSILNLWIVETAIESDPPRLPLSRSCIYLEFDDCILNPTENQPVS